MTREQALACTPVHNNVISWEEDRSGLVQVEYVLLAEADFSFQFSNDLHPNRPMPRPERLNSMSWGALSGR